MHDVGCHVPDRARSGAKMQGKIDQIAASGEKTFGGQ